jgi:hypothetical protein
MRKVVPASTRTCVFRKNLRLFAYISAFSWGCSAPPIHDTSQRRAGGVVMRGIHFGFLVAVLTGVAACGETSSEPGDQHPVDQCVNDADQAIYDELGAAIGEAAGDCPLTSCGGQLGTIIGGDPSEAAAMALADCIAQCVSDETGLSTECSNCYGLITNCAVGTCFEPCAPPNTNSPECTACSLEHCNFFDACLGI